MSETVSLDIDSDDVLHQIDGQTVVDFFGADLLDHFTTDQLLDYLMREYQDEVIDRLEKDGFVIKDKE